VLLRGNSAGHASSPHGIGKALDSGRKEPRHGTLILVWKEEPVLLRNSGGRATVPQLMLQMHLHLRQGHGEHSSVSYLSGSLGV
jgi:hypothetical protein